MERSRQAADFAERRASNLSGSNSRNRFSTTPNRGGNAAGIAARLPAPRQFAEPAASTPRASLISRELVGVREDIGRHNAVDKVIGRAFLDGGALSRHILVVSGRSSLEIVQKALARDSDRRGGFRAIVIGVNSPGNVGRRSLVSCGLRHSMCIRTSALWT